MDETEIISRLKMKDQDAFLYVVDSYKKKVASLCFSYTSDYYEAEDLSQEVFIALFNSIKNYRGECSLSTYLYKITISKCLDFKRKKSIKNFLTGLISISRDESEDQDLDEKNFIRQCISSLPQDLKAPLVLYYYIGLSQKEIGEILELSSRAVEGRIYRAKSKLKEKLEKEGYSACRQNGMI